MADGNYDEKTRRSNKRQKKGSFEKEKSDVFLKKAKLSQLLLDQGVNHSPFLENKYETDSSFPSSSDSENSSDEELEDNFWPQNLLADLNEIPDSEFLRLAPFVTEEEMLHRRRDKIKQLMKHYKLQFHRLRSVLKKRHLKYLKSKHKLAEDINRPIDTDIRKKLRRKHKLMQHYLKSVNFPEDSTSTLNNGNNIKKKRKYILIDTVKKLCSFQGCKASYILHDPKQKLFTNCCHSNVTGICNYPVLIGQNPRLCPAHLEIQMLAMQREAILKNQKRKQLDDQKAQMAAQQMLNKKPTLPTQPVTRPAGITSMPVTSNTGQPMPININGFPLSQLSVGGPRLIPIGQSGQPIQDKKDTVTVATGGPTGANASPNVTRINFPNPTAIYAYNVMFSAPNGQPNTTATTTTNKAPTIVTPNVTTVRQNPVQVTAPVTNMVNIASTTVVPTPNVVNTNPPPVKKS